VAQKLLDEPTAGLDPVTKKVVVGYDDCNYGVCNKNADDDIDRGKDPPSDDNDYGSNDHDDDDDDNVDLLLSRDSTNFSIASPFVSIFAQ
jgi:hypothetical protein